MRLREITQTLFFTIRIDACNPLVAAATGADGGRQATHDSHHRVRPRGEEPEGKEDGQSQPAR